MGLSSLVARGLAGHLAAESPIRGTWPKTYGSRCAASSPLGCTASPVPPAVMRAPGSPAMPAGRHGRPPGPFFGGRPLGLAQQQPAHRGHGHEPQGGAGRPRERGPVDNEHHGHQHTAEGGPAHEVVRRIGRGPGGGGAEWFGVHGPGGTYGFGRGRGSGGSAAGAGRRGRGGRVDDRGRGHEEVLPDRGRDDRPANATAPAPVTGRSSNGVRGRPGGDRCRGHRALPSGAGSCMLRGTPSRFGGLWAGEECRRTLGGIGLGR